MKLPLVTFTDGQSFFDQQATKYKKHSKGLYVFSPSGAGKTYFINQQSEPHWVDGDVMWCESGAQPEPDQVLWWNGGVPMIEEVEKRCDIITKQAVEQGFWIMGSVSYGYKPDAIVIPEWDVLVSQIRNRQNSGDYDGGLTDENLEQLKNHIAIIERWHTEHGVPKFTSIQEAADSLTKDLS